MINIKKIYNIKWLEFLRILIILFLGVILGWFYRGLFSK